MSPPSNGKPKRKKRVVTTEQKKRAKERRKYRSDETKQEKKEKEEARIEERGAQKYQHTQEALIEAREALIEARGVARGEENAKRKNNLELVGMMVEANANSKKTAAETCIKADQVLGKLIQPLLETSTTPSLSTSTPSLAYDTGTDKGRGRGREIVPILTIDTNVINVDEIKDLDSTADETPPTPSSTSPSTSPSTSSFASDTGTGTDVERSPGQILVPVLTEEMCPRQSDHVTFQRTIDHQVDKIRCLERENSLLRQSYDQERHRYDQERHRSDSLQARIDYLERHRPASQSRDYDSDYNYNNNNNNGYSELEPPPVAKQTSPPASASEPMAGLPPLIMKSNSCDIDDDDDILI